MTDVAEATDDDRKRDKTFQFPRHNPNFRLEFESTAAEMQGKCPVAWSDTYGGHWVAASHEAIFDIARESEVLSNDHDVTNTKRGYQGISIPSVQSQYRGGFLEMDPPEQREYRQSLNAYLSPAAVARWKPFVEVLTQSCLDEVIESGRVDFVDDLANIVPAVFTLAMLGLPLADWEIYCEPAHAAVYTPFDSPDFPRVMAASMLMAQRMTESLAEIRQTPRPGMINALVNAEIGDTMPPDNELSGVIGLLIGGGFDTTTALTAHSLEWLSDHPAERARLSAERETLLDAATEEFLRFYTPAQGDGRTFSADCALAGAQFKEGERLWLSWAMANRDPSVFPNPNEIQLDRHNNRHTSFGLGIHRCIGSNMARMAFKTMLTQVLDRMPDFVTDSSGAVHYETTGVINGMQHLPATFTPGQRLGPSFAETLVTLQKACDEQQLAEPITVRSAAAKIG